MKTSHVRVVKDFLSRSLDVICRRGPKQPADIRPGDLIAFGQPLVKFNVEGTKSGRSSTHDNESEYFDESCTISSFTL